MSSRNYNSSNEPLKKRLAFNYKLLKPFEGSNYELSFEEVRAQIYNKMYEAEAKAEAKCKSELEEKIKSLENELAKAKQSNQVESCSIGTTSEACTNTTVVEVVINPSKRTSSRSKYSYSGRESSETTGYDNLTCVSSMSHMTSAKTPFATRNFNDDDDTFNVSEFTIANKDATGSLTTTWNHTTKNITTNTRMARQEMNKFFDHSDSTIDATIPKLNLVNLDEKENRIGEFSIYQEKVDDDKSKTLYDNSSNSGLQSKSLRQDGSLLLNEKPEILPKPKTSQENSRKPLSVIKEPDDMELEIDEVLNDQDTAKIAFNPDAMSTCSIKPLLAKKRNFNFNDDSYAIDNEATGDLSLLKEIVTKKVENDDERLSKIIVEDMHTQYGWMKMMNSKKKMDTVPEETTSNKIFETPSNQRFINDKDKAFSATKTTNFSWDYYKEEIFTDAVDNKSAFQFSVLASDKNSETIPEFHAHDLPTETLNINKDKYKTPHDAYHLCGNMTTYSVTESICATNKSILKEKTSIFKSNLENTQCLAKLQADMTTNITSQLINNASTLPAIVEPSFISTDADSKDNTISRTLDASNITGRLVSDVSTLPAVVDPSFLSTGADLKNKTIDKTPRFIDEVFEEKNNEFLTTEKFNETLSNNLKACFNTSTARLNTSSFLGNMSVLSKLDLSTLRLDTTKNLFGKTQQLTTSLHTSRLLNIDETNLEDEDQTDVLSETIVNSIQQPFNIDFKNKLLAKQSEFFANRSNYMTLAIEAPSVQLNGCVTLSNYQLHIVKKEIGSGAYANIFLVHHAKEIKNSNKNIIALKVSRQATAWEFYITETIHERLKMLQSKVCMDSSFIRIKEFTRYNNGSLCTMPYYKNGTVLDLINYHVEKQETMPYWFVLYLMIELLSIINCLHKIKIIHGDIKPDNMMIDKLPDSLGFFDPTRTKTIVLIDFNRSIDLKILPVESEFNAKVDNKSLLCCEMKAEKPWTYQIDYFGILSIIHCLILRKYMNTYEEAGRFKMSSSFPRSYDKVFNRFFDVFMNVPSCKEMPDLENEWIPQFVSLFKTEITNFPKSQKYLKDLNAFFNS